ncbi:MAG: hypothetical protein RR973_06765 [Anaerovoracaceae bacterium]
MAKGTVPDRMFSSAGASQPAVLSGLVGTAVKKVCLFRRVVAGVVIMP